MLQATNSRGWLPLLFSAVNANKITSYRQLYEETFGLNFIFRFLRKGDVKREIRR